MTIFGVGAGVAFGLLEFYVLHSSTTAKSAVMFNDITEFLLDQHANEYRAEHLNSSQFD